ncbi:MAG: hypothetical protein NC336_06555 [Clostridium sp.]|nr:hypothetical protein [Clostridium sp.]
MKNTTIDGSLAVGRTVSAAGDLFAGGSVTVRRNLSVGGWLDAPNLRTPAKGLFPDEASLSEAAPHPRQGEWALVGASLPATLYVVSDGRWQSTGRSIALPALDTSSFTAALAESQAIFDAMTDTLAEARDVVEQTRSEASAAERAASEALEASRRAEASSKEAATLLPQYLTRIEEAEAAGDEAFERAVASGIVPFSGILPARPGAVPKTGVWFETGNDSRPGRFRVLSAHAGLTEEDYNDLDTDDRGYCPARGDCLFRAEGRLYRYDDRTATLVELSPMPVLLSSPAEFAELRDNGLTTVGRLYCSVDPETSRVTNLFVG